MSSPAQSVKQRGAQGSKKRSTTPGGAVDGAVDKSADVLDRIQHEAKAAVSNDWDYKIAIVVVTILAFATRFYGITHPKQVVFDEVHFGKVSTLELLLDGKEGSVHVTDQPLKTTSLPRTISSAHISSMYTLRLASFSLPLPAGSWATMANSCLTTLATLISRTRCRMWPTDRCQP